jgi:ATPase subunit of ABC transporter with duplicated ATPase domains
VTQLVARDLTFSHGPNVVLDGVSVTIAPGHRVGVVGPNGVGKSTLLRLITGELLPDSGTVERVPGDATVGHLTQELHVGPGETVADVVARRTGAAAAQHELDQATGALASGAAGADERYSAALEHWLRIGAADLDHRLGAVLDQVGLGAGGRDQPADTLSGGQRARVNLASVLLSGFDVLALDEPTNDLDLAGLALLEDFLTSSGDGYLLVSHDRAFLERVVTGVLELDEHTRQGTRFDGGWQAYLDLQAAARRHAAEAYGDYVDTRDTLVGQAQQTREWSAKGVRKAKRSGETDKFIKHSNKASSEKLAGKAARAEKALERLDVVDKPWEGWDLRLEFATTGRPGTEVLRVRGLVVERGGFRLGPIDLDVTHGERVTLLGPNGSGKTTLLRAALGELEPSSGSAVLGPSVVVGVLDQHRGRFGGEESLLDAFVGETGVSPTEARSQLAKLGLGAEHVSRPTSRLSPGERTRAVLAAFALVGVNLLVLDEPTNHLDLPAIEQLEQALEHFPGTLLLVTHDRQLLQAVATTRRIELAGGQIVADGAT